MPDDTSLHKLCLLWENHLLDVGELRGGLDDTLANKVYCHAALTLCDGMEIPPH
jgi:hypothetical protein